MSDQSQMKSNRVFFCLEPVTWQSSAAKDALDLAGLHASTHRVGDEGKETHRNRERRHGEVLRRR